MNSARLSILDTQQKQDAFNSAIERGEMHMKFPKGFILHKWDTVKFERNLKYSQPIELLNTTLLDTREFSLRGLNVCRLSTITKTSNSLFVIEPIIEAGFNTLRALRAKNLRKLGQRNYLGLRIHSW